MRRGHFLLALLALVGVGCSCSSTPPTRRATDATSPPSLVFELSERAAFFDRPFPSDARRTRVGAPDYSGLPNPGENGIVAAALEAAAETRGFTPNVVVSLRFDGPFAVPKDDPLARTRADARIFVIDVDPASPARGTRYPIHLAFTERADSVRPAHLLQLLPVPGLGLPPGRTYAAVVLTDAPADGSRLSTHPLLSRLLEEEHDTSAGGEASADRDVVERWHRTFAPLREALPLLGVQAGDIAAATVFSTEDPTARLRALVAEAFAAEPVRLLELDVRDEHPDFTALKGRVELPIYLTGAAPYLFQGGKLVSGPRGGGRVQRRVEAEFQLSIPKGKMPASGFPLYFYIHGTGGLPSQAIDRGRRPSPDASAPKGSGLAATVSPVGFATSCVAGTFSPARLGFRALDGYAGYNFFRAGTMRDNFAQMLLEQAHFLRFLLALEIDAGLVPEADASAAPDGKIRFDPQLVVVGGQSLGSYLSGMLAGALPVFQGAILTGAGGSWMEFAFGPKDPVDLEALTQSLILPLGEKLDRFHPYITLVAQAAAEADNTHYTRRILRDPAPGTSPPHVLIVEGHVDLQVPTNLQRALVLSVGADLLGEDVGDAPEDRLEPVLPWGGQRQLRGEAQSNFRLASGEARTAVAVRYAEDGILEGHYVWMQREEPKRHIRAFLEALKRGEAPRVLEE